MNKTEVFIDLDGTLAGQNDWVGYWKSTSSLFKSGLLYRPPLSLNWNILTARPKIDRPIIQILCNFYKIYPKRIITSPTWSYDFKNHKEIADWKASVLIKTLADNMFLEKAIYVDNDPSILNEMLVIGGMQLCSIETFNIMMGGEDE